MYIFTKFCSPKSRATLSAQLKFNLCTKVFQYHCQTTACCQSENTLLKIKLEKKSQHNSSSIKFTEENKLKSSSNRLFGNKKNIAIIMIGLIHIFFQDVSSFVNMPFEFPIVFEFPIYFIQGNKFKLEYR